MAKNVEELFVHVQLDLSVSEQNSYWYNPRSSKNLSFDIPVDMFSEDALAKKIEKTMKELKEGYPQAKADYEAEQAKEAAVKAAKEAAKANV